MTLLIQAEGLMQNHDNFHTNVQRCHRNQAVPLKQVIRADSHLQYPSLLKQTQ